MDTNFPDLPIREYRFQYQALEELKLPPFPGRLLHGAFGNALRETLCTEDKETDCASCEEHSHCGYPFFFRNNIVNTAVSLKGVSDFPPPHVLRFSEQYFRQIPAKHQFTIDLLVIGEANDRIDEVIGSMHTLGKLGIYRKQAQLVNIEQCIPYGLSQQISSPADHISAATPSLPACPEFVTVSLTSPHLMKQTNHEFDVGKWLMAVIRRTSLLSELYAKNAKDAEYDFKHLKSLCNTLPFSEANLYLYETPKGQRNSYEGLLGSFQLHLAEHTELWPWLHLGQWIHAGKKTSFGFGAYRLSVAPAIT